MSRTIRTDSDKRLTLEWKIKQHPLLEALIKEAEPFFYI